MNDDDDKLCPRPSKIVLLDGVARCEACGYRVPKVKAPPTPEPSVSERLLKFFGMEPRS